MQQNLLRIVMSSLGGTLGAVVFSFVFGALVTHEFPLGWLLVGAGIGLVLSFTKFRASVEQRIIDGFHLKVQVTERSFVADIIWSVVLVGLLMISFVASTTPAWNVGLVMTILGSSFSIGVPTALGSWLLSKTVDEPEAPVTRKNARAGGSGTLVGANLRVATSPASEGTTITTRISAWWALKPWWFQDLFLLALAALAIVTAFNVTAVLGKIFGW